MRPFKPTTWIVFSFLAFASMFSARAADYVTNQVTLDECIRQALEHNLDIQIARKSPLITRYDLSASYSIYDPVFDAAYENRSTTREGDIVGGTQIRPSEEDDDFYRVGLGGRLPMGLQYDMGFQTTRSDQQVTDFDTITDTNGNVFITNLTTLTFKDYRSFVGIDLRQPLLDGFWTDAERTQIKIVKRDLEISEYDLTLILMQTVRDVRVAYFNLLEAQELVVVGQKALQLATQLWEENKKRVQAGTMAQLEEKQAESEKELARAELMVSERRVLLRENELKRLLTDNYEQWQNTRLQPAEKLLAVPEVFERGEAWINALQKRPDFAARKLQLEQQGFQVKLRQNQLLPTLDLVGSYGRSGLDPQFGGSISDIQDETSPSYTFGVQLSVPLFNRQERYRLRSAKEQEEQLKLNLQQLHQAILIGVDDAINSARSSFDEIPAWRLARIYAEQALDAEQKKYENGKSTSFLVLEFQNRLTEARAQEISALAEYNRFLADFYFSEGTILERSNILVESR